jgi:methylenetetrahydrofolate dehydrogenase (NADP+) / methenyltetrahydrofolate cyclohydrolase
VAKVAELNVDDEVDAILVQLPLPPHMDEANVIRAVAPAKDVDGFHPLNAGELYLGRPAIVSATPRGIMALLAEHHVELDGAHAVVIGRSDIVGKPLALLLLHANATVTLCHSHTRDLPRHTLDADVLVAAVGVPALVSPDMVKERAVVVDVGMNRTDAGLVGDVDPGAAEIASAMTPVPGGVGPMTIACLLENAVRCARFRTGELVYPG